MFISLILQTRVCIFCRRWIENRSSDNVCSPSFAASAIFLSSCLLDQIQCSSLLLWSSLRWQTLQHSQHLRHARYWSLLRSCLYRSIWNTSSLTVSFIISLLNNQFIFLNIIFDDSFFITSLHHIKNSVNQCSQFPQICLIVFFPFLNRSRYIFNWSLKRTLAVISSQKLRIWDIQSYDAISWISRGLWKKSVLISRVNSSGIT